MMLVIARITKGLLRPINPYASPIIIGCLTAVWGAWVLSPFWDVFTTAPLFSMMAGLCPEWVWGAGAMIFGCSLIYSNITRNMRGTSTALWLCSWFWGMVALLMWVGDWRNTGGLTYTWICLWANFCYLNIKINHMVCTEDGN